jgi:hypothetical protein
MASWISGILVFDETKPLVARYFGEAKERQISIEKDLIRKLSAKENISDLLLVDKYILQIKSSSDVYIGVLYDLNENDVIIQSFLESVFKALGSLVGSPISKRKVTEKLDSVFLLIDEVCESGIILEDDPERTVGRVEMREDGSASSSPAISSAQASSQSLDWKSMLAQARGQIGTFLSSR